MTHWAGPDNYPAARVGMVLRGGPDMLSSLRNNHMTILHSSLHKYNILAVHDLHCIPKYIHIVRAYNIE